MIIRPVAWKARRSLVLLSKSGRRGAHPPPPSPNFACFSAAAVRELTSGRVALSPTPQKALVACSRAPRGRRGVEKALRACLQLRACFFSEHSPSLSFVPSLSRIYFLSVPTSLSFIPFFIRTIKYTLSFCRRVLSLAAPRQPSAASCTHDLHCRDILPHTRSDSLVTTCDCY